MNDATGYPRQGPPGTGEPLNLLPGIPEEKLQSASRRSPVYSTVLVAWFFHPCGFERKAKTLLDQELTGPAPTMWTEEEGKMNNNATAGPGYTSLSCKAQDGRRLGRAEQSGAQDSV